MNVDQLRQYVQLSVMDKLDEFSLGFFECNCFAAYLQLSHGDTEYSNAAKEILSGYEWDECPQPRCPECTDELYNAIQEWMPMIMSGGLKNMVDEEE